jgi:putative transcriptional regulator
MINEIRVERARMKISQEELANRVKVTRQTIHSIETGKKNPSVELALRIAKIFNISVEKLFKLK